VLSDLSGDVIATKTDPHRVDARAVSTIITDQSDVTTPAGGSHRRRDVGH
jgi:hypothetical protein